MSLLVLLFAVCVAANTPTTAEVAQEGDMTAAFMWMSAGALELIAVCVARVCVPAFTEYRRRRAHQHRQMVPFANDIEQGDTIQ